METAVCSVQGDSNGGPLDLVVPGFGVPQAAIIIGSAARGLADDVSNHAFYTYCGYAGGSIASVSVYSATGQANSLNSKAFDATQVRFADANGGTRAIYQSADITDGIRLTRTSGSRTETMSFIALFMKGLTGAHLYAGDNDARTINAGFEPKAVISGASNITPANRPGQASGGASFGFADTVLNYGSHGYAMGNGGGSTLVGQRRSADALTGMGSTFGGNPTNLQTITAKDANGYSIDLSQATKSAWLLALDWGKAALASNKEVTLAPGPWTFPVGFTAAGGIFIWQSLAGSATGGRDSSVASDGIILVDSAGQMVSFDHLDLDNVSTSYVQTQMAGEGNLKKARDYQNQILQYDAVINDGTNFGFNVSVLNTPGASRWGYLLAFEGTPASAPSNIYFGSELVNELQFGGNPVTEVYYGNTKVFG